MGALARMPWLGGVAVFLLTFAAMFVAWPHATPYNNYVYLADAFLHRTVAVDTPPYIDALLYRGERYIIEGPFPAVLLLPFVAIWHLQTNQTILSWALAALAATAGWELARRFGVPLRSRIVLWLFLVFG
ncbi:MAG: hypothetical protein JO359_02145, partial [Candidatus Eremiobacteraeota bacterium]|nr:hypothetical protein [Candidatus Eremiobacteraeota bacterium]